MRKAVVSTVLLPALSLLMFSQAPKRQAEPKQMVADKQIMYKLYGDKLDEPWKYSQQEAKAATGVVLSEEGETLYLDIEPCSSKVMKFSKPYESTDTGKTVKCKEPATGVQHELPLFFVRPK